METMGPENYRKLKEFLFRFGFNLSMEGRRYSILKHPKWGTLVLDFIQDSATYQTGFNYHFGSIRRTLIQFSHLIPLSLYEAQAYIKYIQKPKFYLKLGHYDIYVFWDREAERYTCYPHGDPMSFSQEVDHLPHYWAQILEQVQQNYNYWMYDRILSKS